MTFMGTPQLGVWWCSDPHHMVRVEVPLKVPMVPRTFNLSPAPWDSGWTTVVMPMRLRGDSLTFLGTPLMEVRWCFDPHHMVRVVVPPKVPGDCDQNPTPVAARQS